MYMKTSGKWAAIYLNKWFLTIVLMIICCGLSTTRLVSLPQGGAATFFSLFVLWLFTYIFGWAHGLVCSLVFGMLKIGINFAIGEYVNTHPGAILLEYVLGYGIFCIGGLLLRNKPGELKLGYLMGVFGQFVFFVISAVLFYPPDRVGFWANLGYCIVYDASYLIIEVIITMILLRSKAVIEVIDFIKQVSNDGEDPTLKSF